jgi:hypothetical protein
MVAATRSASLGGRLQGGQHGGRELVVRVVEQRQVELHLPGEVLVEHGFAHARPLGDLVHGRGVVSRADEDFLGRLQELGPARLPAQPCTAARWDCIVRGHVAPSAVGRGPFGAVNPSQ